MNLSSGSPRRMLCTSLKALSAVTNANGMQVVDSWTEPSSPILAITGTRMYMAIQVLQGGSHSPNTALESLLYTILSVCTDDHLCDRSANFMTDPDGAAAQRLGMRIAPDLKELQIVPHKLHNFLAALHSVFFPRVVGQLQRKHETEVSPADVKAACKDFIPNQPSTLMPLIN